MVNDFKWNCGDMAKQKRGTKWDVEDPVVKLCMTECDTSQSGAYVVFLK